MKNYSIEYAHIYTNDKISEEHRLSLEILGELKREKDFDHNTHSLVVLIDDYSFPDLSFDYQSFAQWLKTEGYEPDIILRESQLIPMCDELLKNIEDENLKKEIKDYILAKKYPCSLFIAAWYLIRLGYLESNIFDKNFIAKKLVNILPESFKPFEDRALNIIRATKFNKAVEQIEYKFIMGRKL